MIYTLVLSLLACGPSTSPAPQTQTVAAGSPTDAEKEAALKKATDAAKALEMRLKETLIMTMKVDGAADVVNFCNETAPTVAAEISSNTGVTVGRSSTKLRNPDNAPNPWVNAWLLKHDGKPASEAAMLREVVQTEEGAFARVILPIAVAPGCLICHGPKENIPTQVSTNIAAHYPQDAATGYAVGDLRGGIYAQYPLK